MDTFDYIIVGGGSAGCVLANRLSADSSLQVLLLEAGPPDRTPLIRMPKGFGALMGNTTHVRHFQTEPPAGFGIDMWPRGKTIGGSSSVNGTLYVRGQPEDYDDWAACGAKGWSWAEVAPAFVALEDHALGAGDTRGVGGPVHVSPVARPHMLSLATVDAGASLGLARKEDINALPQQGIGLAMTNIRDGVRVSAGSAFLKPAARRPNLRVVTGTFVNKVTLEGTRATGVEVVQKGGTVRYRAKREVLLSAGTIQSPQLLQLSGIGPAGLLRELGIEVISAREEVGRNLREHWMAFVQHDLRNPISYNKEFGGLRLVRHTLEYALFRQGLMAGSSHEVCGFANVEGTSERPDVQLMMAPFSLVRQPGPFKFEDGHGMQITGYQLRPESRGTVMINSADPLASPVIRPNYLGTELDRRVSVAAVRFIRKLYAAPPLAALVGPETMPGPMVDTDDEILDAIRSTGQSVMHCAGTCRMGSDAGSVVDERLRVRGVTGLRVVDCSVMPSLVSGNTNAAVMMIAWRAAEMILADSPGQA